MSRISRRRSIGRQLTRSYAVLILATAGISFAAAYWGTALWLDRRINDSLSAEFEGLVRHHSGEMPESLPSEIERRIQQPGRNDYVYILTESHYERIVGNLPAWPEGLEPQSRNRRMSIQVLQGTTQSFRRVEVESRSLPGGRHLLVGRDVTKDEALLETLGIAMLAGFVFSALLALAGGLSMSRRLLRRVEGMNATVLDILGGHLNERVPHVADGDEFDELADHFNRLLDENARLICRMREVTDDVAHDLRTPLARVRTRIETALAEGGDDSPATEVLRDLMADTGRILETFNALIHIAKIENRSIQEEMETLALDDLARDAVDLYGPLVEESDSTLVCQAEDAIHVQGNRHLLSQALANLIENAIKYSGRSSEITVAAKRHAGRPVLEVIDRGPGIPEAERARVLERFVRLDTSRGQPGSGLGLSFVSAVADHHGAELELLDANPGLCVRIVFSGT